MKIELRNAQPGDAKRLAEVYNASFYSDYMKYGACPGYGKTEESMLSAMKTDHVFTIIADGIIAGAAAVRQEAAHHYYLGALCVIPAYAGKGIGQEAMQLLDGEFPDARHWALETPADKLQNHYVYKKLGFVVTKEYMDGSVRISYFERQIQD